jgi:hypothetical protein
MRQNQSYKFLRPTHKSGCSCPSSRTLIDGGSSFMRCKISDAAIHSATPKSCKSSSFVFDINRVRHLQALVQSRRTHFIHCIHSRPLRFLLCGQESRGDKSFGHQRSQVHHFIRFCQKSIETIHSPTPKSKPTTRSRTSSIGEAYSVTHTKIRSRNSFVRGKILRQQFRSVLHNLPDQIIQLLHKSACS